MKYEYGYLLENWESWPVGIMSRVPWSVCCIWTVMGWEERTGVEDEVVETAAVPDVCSAPVR